MLEKMLMDLQRNQKAHGILISFTGRFSQGIIEELGDAIKRHMEAEDRPRNDIYNVFAIFVEQTQNIRNYSFSKKGSVGYDYIANSGIITIGKNQGGYFICSGNLIEKGDAPALADRIKQLANLDKNVLKRLYKEQIKRDLPFGSMGAGVGLFDIARKASQPIEYNIIDIDENVSFFTIKVTV